MKYFANFVGRISGLGMAVGAVSLVGIMLLVVANIITRLCGSAIMGTFELINFMIVVTVAFALGYTALKKGHIVVEIVTSRFSPRVQAILEILTSIIGLGFWAVIAWATVMLMVESGFEEQTELLELSYLPFRSIFVLGLMLFFSVLLVNLYKALRQAVRK